MKTAVLQVKTDRSLSTAQQPVYRPSKVRALVSSNANWHRHQRQLCVKKADITIYPVHVTPTIHTDCHSSRSSWCLRRMKVAHLWSALYISYTFISFANHPSYIELDVNSLNDFSTKSLISLYDTMRHVCSSGATRRIRSSIPASNLFKLIKTCAKSNDGFP